MWRTWLAYGLLPSPPSSSGHVIFDNRVLDFVNEEATK
jgi:hypothetical protein